MSFKAAICPSCGGNLQLPDDRNVVKCMYCGVDVIVRDAIQAAVAGSIQNWMKLAYTAAQDRQYQDAFNYFTKVLEINADYAEAWLGRAEVFPWLSTSQHNRLPEIFTAIRRALDLAPVDKRPIFGARAGLALGNASSQYYKAIYTDWSTMFNVEPTWKQYLNQCSIIIGVLEEAHRLLPREKPILQSLIYLCTQNSQKLFFYAKGSNNRWSQHKREPPRDFTENLKAKLAYYTARLYELDPSLAPIRQAEIEPPKGLWLKLKERL